MIFENEEAARESLTSSRARLTEIDHEIIELLALRTEVAFDVAYAKQVLGLPARVPEQHSQVIEERLRYAARLGLSRTFALSVVVPVLEESVAIQDSVLHTEPVVAHSVTPVRIRQGSAVAETGEESFRAVLPPLARDSRFIAE